LHHAAARDGAASRQTCLPADGDGERGPRAAHRVGANRRAVAARRAQHDHAAAGRLERRTAWRRMPRLFRPLVVVYAIRT
jgi:hypothetical protein